MSDTARTTLRLMKLHQQQRAKIASLTRQVVESARAHAEALVTKSVSDGKERQLYGVAEDEAWPALSMAAILVTDLGREEQEAILSQLPSDLRDDLTDRLYSFDALPRLPDREIQGVLAHVDARTLGLALIGCDSPLMEMVTKNMSSRAADMLREDIDSYVNAGEISTIDVRLARESISHSIRLLYLEGQIGA